jgi:hypothetical protein
MVAVRGRPLSVGEMLVWDHFSRTTIFFVEGIEDEGGCPIIFFNLRSRNVGPNFYQTVNKTGK